LPIIKVYAVTRQLHEDELKGYRISSCHQDIIIGMILKCQVRLEYPQHLLIKTGMSVASKQVDLECVPTYVFIPNFPKTDGFHYFSYPGKANHHKRIHKSG
jgi:hypothetical protein